MTGRARAATIGLAVVARAVTAVRTAADRAGVADHAVATGSATAARVSAATRCGALISNLRAVQLRLSCPAPGAGNVSLGSCSTKGYWPERRFSPTCPTSIFPDLSKGRRGT